MKLHKSVKHSFIVRVWRQNLENMDEKAELRGEIIHVPNNEQTRIKTASSKKKGEKESENNGRAYGLRNLKEIITFITSCFNK